MFSAYTLTNNKIRSLLQGKIYPDILIHIGI